MGLFDDVLNSAKTGNFDDVLTKTKSYAEDAAKKSAERLEISKKKIELLDSKTKLAKAYEKYGKLQFDILEGAEVSEDELAYCVDSIRLQKNRSLALDAEIEELKKIFADGIKETKSYEKVFRRDSKNVSSTKKEEVETTAQTVEE